MTRRPDAEAMTGAVPSTSLSSDHACFRQRVGPGQAGDSTTRRGWVIAAWVLDGRAGSGTTDLYVADAREQSPAPSSRSTDTSTGCSLPVILTPIRLQEKGLRTRDVGEYVASACRRRVAPASPSTSDSKSVLRPSRRGQQVAATLSTTPLPPEQCAQIWSSSDHPEPDLQCSEHGGLLA
jgi:hypothetical protein